MATMKFTRIDSFLSERYKDCIDLSDRPAHSKENDLKSQGLIALYLEFSCGLLKEEACRYITDQGTDDTGKNDNGIDGIYYDNSSRTLYLLQSKYMSEGNTISGNDIKSFKNGILDIYNTKFNNFGKKLNSHKVMLDNAKENLNKIKIVLISNTNQTLDSTKQDVINSILNEDEDIFDFEFIDFNKTFDIIKQLDKSAPEIRGFKFKQHIMMEGGIFKTYFGIVDGETLGNIWKEYGRSLLYNNLRGFLKNNSNINESIKNTIDNEPNKFFYYNNGITAICDSITRVGTGDSQNFTIKNISIVNGAQTIGSIGSCEDTNKLKEIRVFVRIIDVGSTQENSAFKITKKTNTQNEVGYIDFASLAPENSRIHEDLYNEGILYSYKRDNNFEPSDTSISLDEILRTRACCLDKLSYITLAKKYVYQLADTEGTIFPEIINQNLTVAKIKNSVFLFRKIENVIKMLKNSDQVESMAKECFSHAPYFCLYLLNKDMQNDPSLNYINITETIIKNKLKLIYSAYKKHFSESNRPISLFRVFTNVDFLDVLCQELLPNYTSIKNKNINQLQLNLPQI